MNDTIQQLYRDFLICNIVLYRISDGLYYRSCIINSGKIINDSLLGDHIISKANRFILKYTTT